MMLNLIFEKAVEEQADILVAFEKIIDTPKLYGHPLDLINAIQAIRDNNFYFIKNNGELVATASYHMREDNSCHISNLAVTPTSRGKGIARAAMNFLMEKCLHALRIDLVTHPDNSNAISLYKSLGFSITTRIENYYGDGEPRLVMVKQGIQRGIPHW